VVTSKANFYLNLNSKHKKGAGFYTAP